MTYKNITKSKNLTRSKHYILLMLIICLKLNEKNVKQTEFKMVVMLKIIHFLHQIQVDLLNYLLFLS